MLFYMHAVIKMYTDKSINQKMEGNFNIKYTLISSACLNNAKTFKNNTKINETIHVPFSYNSLQSCKIIK